MLKEKRINLHDARQKIRESLQTLGEATPGNTSLILLGHLLNQSKPWVLAHPEIPLTQNQISTLKNIINRLLQGVPVPYILGQWAFYGESFIVTPDVLIPRPETEQLVAAALSAATRYRQPKIVDVGTGTGVIAISLANHLRKGIILAADLSCAALQVAARNHKRLAKYPVHFIQTDLLSPFKTKFDLICANLPYIPSHKLSSLPVAQHEPRLALDGGENGLLLIERLLRQAKHRLAEDGLILLEIESTLGEACLNLVKDLAPQWRPTIRKDLAGLNRLLIIQA